jgi:hypothetical protein
LVAAHVFRVELIKERGESRQDPAVMDQGSSAASVDVKQSTCVQNAAQNLEIPAAAFTAICVVKIR